MQALLAAIAQGESLAPAPAPSKIDPERGSVRIPQKWHARIRGALQEVVASDAAEDAEAEEQHQQRQDAAAAARGGSGAA